MAKAFIAFPNRADQATLTGGACQIGLDALKDPVLARVARFADSDPDTTWLAADLGRAMPVRIVVLAGHNMDLSATYRVRTYGDEEMTELREDSGWLDVFPRLFDWRDLKWGDLNFWSGKVSVEDLDLYPRSIIHLLSAETTTRIVRIDLSNPDNAAGYLEAGRLYVAPGWEPSYNFVYGASIGHETDTKTAKAISGDLMHDRRPSLRAVTLGYEHIPPTEGINQAMALVRRAGVDRDVFFCFDPANPQLLHQRSFLGKLRALPALAYNNPKLTSMTIEIVEVAWGGDDDD